MNPKNMQKMLEAIHETVKVKSISVTSLGYVIYYSIDTHTGSHETTCMIQTNMELMILEGEIAGAVDQAGKDAMKEAQKEVDAGTATIPEPKA